MTLLRLHGYASALKFSPFLRTRLLQAYGEGIHHGEVIHHPYILLAGAVCSSEEEKEHLSNVCKTLGHHDPF